MKSLDSKTPNQDWHPNIWPPFTQINNSKPQIEVTHGKDALLFTKDPEKVLDSNGLKDTLNQSIEATHAKADISRIPVPMDHAGEEDANIMLLCVENITMITRKGMFISVIVWNGQIESIHNLPGNTCPLLCRLEKIQNPTVRKYLMV